MAWPSTTKASTQYTDSPTDRIADARAEINQNISNVNDIIDTFTLTSPNDGDTLEYDSGTSSFVAVAGSRNIAHLQFDDYIQFTSDSAGAQSDNTYEGTFTITDTMGLTSSGNNLYFPTGTYTCMLPGGIFNTGSSGPGGGPSNVTIRLEHSDSAGAESLVVSTNSTITTSGTRVGFILGFSNVFTISDATRECTFNMSGNYTGNFDPPAILFIKLA